MTDKVKFSLFSGLPDSTKEEALNPSTNLIGQAFRGITHKILDPLVRMNIVKDAEMENFTNKVKSKTDSIPIENRDDSKLGLTLKSVEDSAYQLNEETLREMFSNLVSATVDNRVNEKVQPSFSSILKDISSTDASLFNLIYSEQALAVVSIRLQSKENGNGIYLDDNIVLYEGETITMPSSLNVLQRFGLITINSDTNLVAKKYADQYQHFEESDYFKNVQNRLPFNSQDNVPLEEAKLIKGHIKTTAFGKDFGSVVISES